MKSENPGFGFDDGKVAETVEDANKLAKTLLLVFPLLTELQLLLLLPFPFIPAATIARGGDGSSKTGLGSSINSGTEFGIDRTGDTAAAAAAAGGSAAAAGTGRGGCG